MTTDINWMSFNKLCKVIGGSPKYSKLTFADVFWWSRNINTDTKQFWKTDIYSQKDTKIVLWDYSEYSLSRDWILMRFGKVIKPCTTTRWYLAVHLYYKWKSKSFLLHRLLATLFLDKVEWKDFVNHKDWNKLNNKLDNLEWCTRSENITHARDMLWKAIWYKEIPVYSVNLKTWERVDYDSMNAASMSWFKTPMISRAVKRWYVHWWCRWYKCTDN